MAANKAEDNRELVIAIGTRPIAPATVASSSAQSRFVPIAMAQASRRSSASCLPPSASRPMAASRRPSPCAIGTGHDDSLATVLGLLPAAIGLEAGTEANQPLALAVVGGLLSSTALSLFLVPSIFLLVVKPSAAPQDAPAPAAMEGMHA